MIRRRVRDHSVQIPFHADHAGYTIAGMCSPACFRAIFGGCRIVWQTRVASYCLGIDEWVPLGVVLCLDDGSDVDLMEQRLGIRFLSRERAEQCRRGCGDEPEAYALCGTQEAGLEEVIHASAAGSWLAACSYPGLHLGELARRHNIPLRLRGWEEFQRFSSKAALRECVEALDLPCLPARRLRLKACRYSELASEFGARFVVQRDIDAAGRGTRVIASAKDLAEAGERFAGEEVWAAPYAGTLSFNVNALATEDGTLVSFPSVQIVGQSALNSPASGHCGNDFTAASAVPRRFLDNIREQTARIGGWLADRGYQGLFGLDFVVDDRTGRPCAVDLNPRWQGSTSLQSQAESRQGRVPLAAAELGWRFGLLEAPELIALADRFFEPLEGSQVFLRTAARPWCRCRKAVPAGIYTSELEYRRPALRLGEITDAHEEVVLTGGLPRPGRPMQPGSVVARVCSLRASLEPSAGSLHGWVQQSVSRLYEELALEDAEPQ